MKGGARSYTHTAKTSLNNETMRIAAGKAYRNIFPSLLLKRVEPGDTGVGAGNIRGSDAVDLGPVVNVHHKVATRPSKILDGGNGGTNETPSKMIQRGATQQRRECDNGA